MTNSLIAGNELAGVGHVELFMIGGYVTGHLAATRGDAAIQNMSKFHVDKAFIGVHSINFNVGLTSIATPQMEVKKAIIKAAEKVYVLADSSKFGGGYLSVICPTNEVYKIITSPEYYNPKTRVIKNNITVNGVKFKATELFDALRTLHEGQEFEVIYKDGNVDVNLDVNGKKLLIERIGLGDSETYHGIQLGRIDESGVNQ